MRALIIDVETSGLDPRADHLLEVGMVEWSLDHLTTLRSGSWLVRAPSNAAEAINGIPAAILPFGRGLEGVHREVEAWAMDVSVVLAHNADFDTQWLPPFPVPVVDTAWDFDFPRVCADRKLTALALAHGLAVMEAHRALPDCQLLARLLERVAELGHDVPELLRRGMRPKVKAISLAPFDEKASVKEYGFRWSPDDAWWWRMMPAEDMAALPFRAVTADRLVKVVSLAPFQQKEVVKQHGFRWAGDRKEWWRLMPEEDVAALPFRARVDR